MKISVVGPARDWALLHYTCKQYMDGDDVTSRGEKKMERRDQLVQCLFLYIYQNDDVS
jgi:hypothetical protein